jgi:integrase/recombinase XerD
MNDLLTQIRQRGFTATGIAEKLKQSKSSVTMQLKNQRTMTPVLFKELQNIGISLVDMANGSKEEKVEPDKKDRNKKIAVPDYVYKLYKASKEKAGDNQQRIYDATIGKFLEYNNATKKININRIYLNSDDIALYLKQFKGNEYGYANRHLHWRNLRAFYRWLYIKYDFPNPIVNEKGEYLVNEPKVNKNSVMPSITQKEMEMLLSSPMLDNRDKLIMVLPYGSAMRVSEWSDLTFEDIDVNTHMVKVKTKGGEIRLMDIDMAMPFLKNYLAETGINTGRLFQKSAKYDQLKGRGSFESRLHVNIEPIAKEITGNKNLYLTPHVFRRGNARMNLENKIPDNVAMLHGNWKDPRTYKKYGNAFNIEDASRVIRGAIKLNIGLPTLNP